MYCFQTRTAFDCLILYSDRDKLAPFIFLSKLTHPKKTFQDLQISYLEINVGNYLKYVELAVLAQIKFESFVIDFRGLRILPILLTCVWSYLFPRVSFRLWFFLFDCKLFSQSALNPASHPFAWESFLTGMRGLVLWVCLLGFCLLVYIPLSCITCPLGLFVLPCCSGASGIGHSWKLANGQGA